MNGKDDRTCGIGACTAPAVSIAQIFDWPEMQESQQYLFLCAEHRPQEPK